MWPSNQMTRISFWHQHGQEFASRHIAMSAVLGAVSGNRLMVETLGRDFQMACLFRLKPRGVSALQSLPMLPIQCMPAIPIIPETSWASGVPPMAAQVGHPVWFPLTPAAFLVLDGISAKSGSTPAMPIPFISVIWKCIKALTAPPTGLISSARCMSINMPGGRIRAIPILLSAAMTGACLHRQAAAAPGQNVTIYLYRNFMPSPSIVLIPNAFTAALRITALRGH